MKFKVNTGAGLGDNVMKAGNRDATRRQTEFEHNQLLDITTLPAYKFYEALPEGPQKELARQQTKDSGTIGGSRHRQRRIKKE